MTTVEKGGGVEEVEAFVRSLVVRNCGDRECWDCREDLEEEFELFNFRINGLICVSPLHV